MSRSDLAGEEDLEIDFDQSIEIWFCQAGHGYDDDDDDEVMMMIMMMMMQP